jgi:hypothetical protein
MRRTRKFRWLTATDGTVLVALLTLAMILTILIGNARPSVAHERRAPTPQRSELVEVCAAGHTPAA